MSVLETIEKKYREADEALNMNEPLKAVGLLRELAQAEPKEPLFRWKLGYALSEMHKDREAISEFEHAITLDPQNVAAWGCLGKAHMELGKWEQAEKAIRRRLELKKSPQHYVFLAVILMEQDKYEVAVKACHKAIELDPSFAEAFFNLGLAFRHSKKITEAIEAFRSAVTLDREYAVAYRELGLSLYSIAEMIQAQDALKKCLRLNEKDAWCHFYLALCLQYEKEFEKADEHFQAAIKNEPKNEFFQRKHEEFLQGSEKNGL